MQLVGCDNVCLGGKTNLMELLEIDKTVSRNDWYGIDVEKLFMVTQKHMQ
jgi:hypothetical protein